MKKTMVLGALLASAAACFAQESRQDASVSVISNFAPTVHGTGNIRQSETTTVGFLGSYRYMLTPRSALEANYSFLQNSQTFVVNFVPQGYRVHTRQQEFSLAYVYSLNYHNFSPFLEAGPAAVFFSPIHDFRSTTQDTKRSTVIGGLFGGGVAYELSPSFDIRLQYRGVLVKVPDFGLDTTLSAHRYQVISEPAVGVAYHF